MKNITDKNEAVCAKKGNNWIWPELIKICIMWLYVKIWDSLPFPVPFGFLLHSTKIFWSNVDLPCCANFGKSTLPTLCKRRGKSKYHVILHAFRNCWKILWIDSPNAFVNDISSKKIKRCYSGLLRIQFLRWQDFKYYVCM